MPSFPCIPLLMRSTLLWLRFLFPAVQRWAEGPADTVRQWLQMFEGNMANRFIEDVMVSALCRFVIFGFPWVMVLDGVEVPWDTSRGGS